MTTKIYIRERNKTGSGTQEPRFRIAAITGDRSKIRFSANHFRKAELEAITSDIDAELIYLKPIEEEDEHKGKRNC